MSRINLLPWRTAKREKLKRLFITKLIAALLITSSFMGLIHFYLAQRLDIQNIRDNTLQQQTKIVSQIQSIENLQKNQLISSKLFDELAKILPSGIYLTQIKRENKMITLNGIGNSNMDLSSLMKQIEKSPTMARPVLHEVKTNIFTLQASQK